MNSMRKLAARVRDIFFSIIVLALPFPASYLCLGRLGCTMHIYRFAMWCVQRVMILEKKPERAFSPPVKSKQTDSSLMLSVIIPTCNRVDSLERCLESIYRQRVSLNVFEVIVVNNCCTDGTQTLCERYAGTYNNFLCVAEDTPGLLAARHAGWRASASDILVFCDDDIEADAGWLETIASVFADRPDVCLVGGNCRGAYEETPPSWFEGLWEDWDGLRMNRYYSLLEGIDSPREGSPGMVFGCNFSVRRSLLEKAGGTGPDCMANMLFNGTGENLVCDAANQAGLKAFLHPGASVRHHMPPSRMSLDYMKRRGMYAAIGTMYNMLRNRLSCMLPGLPVPAGDNPGLQAAAEGMREAFPAYLDAALTSKELREWIQLETYFGNEAPPEKALAASSSLAQRRGW